MSKEFHFTTSCVNANGNDIEAMIDAAEEVSIEELRKNCRTALVEHHLGYNRDFPMENDHHVKFYRSTYKGVPCFYIVHSAIEYVFTKRS